MRLQISLAAITVFQLVSADVSGPFALLVSDPAGSALGSLVIGSDVLLLSNATTPPMQGGDRPINCFFYDSLFKTLFSTAACRIGGTEYNMGMSSSGSGYVPYLFAENGVSSTGATHAKVEFDAEGHLVVVDERYQTGSPSSWSYLDVLPTYRPAAWGVPDGVKTKVPVSIMKGAFGTPKD